MLEFLEKEQIDQGIIDGIREYREKYPAAPDMAGRVPRPRYHYYGKEVWEAAAAALLCGENLLLAGSKATTAGIATTQNNLSVSDVGIEEARVHLGRFLVPSAQRGRRCRQDLFQSLLVEAG